MMREHPARHHPPGNLEPGTARAIATWMLDRLPTEHPDLFETAWQDSDRVTIAHHGPGWWLELDLALDRVVSVSRRPSAWKQTLAQAPETADPASLGTILETLSVEDLEGLTCLDALARLVAEDLAIIRRDPAEGRDWLAWIHLAFPNHWSPAAKVGRSFLTVHEPVADFDRVARSANRMLEALVHRGPFVRFAWGWRRIPCSPTIPIRRRAGPCANPRGRRRSPRHGYASSARRSGGSRSTRSPCSRSGRPSRP